MAPDELAGPYRLVCPEHGVRVTMEKAPVQRRYYCGECGRLLEVHLTITVSEEATQ